MYQELFLKQFTKIILLFIVGGLSISYILFSKKYWDRFEKYKDDILAKCMIKGILVFCFCCFVRLSAWPMLKDKPLIDDNKYELLDNATVIQGVTRGGIFGLCEDIIVEYDDKEYDLNVVKADDNINKGDIVKVIYLPNSEYAVIEKIN